MTDDERKAIRSDFRKAVNLSPFELEDWLEIEESQSVGWTPQGEDEAIGHQSGQRIVAIKRPKAQVAVDAGPVDGRQRGFATSPAHEHCILRQTEAEGIRAGALPGEGGAIAQRKGQGVMCTFSHDRERLRQRVGADHADGDQPACGIPSADGHAGRPGLRQAGQRPDMEEGLVVPVGCEPGLVRHVAAGGRRKGDTRREETAGRGIDDRHRARRLGRALEFSEELVDAHVARDLVGGAAPHPRDYGPQQRILRLEHAFRVLGDNEGAL